MGAVARLERKRGRHSLEALKRGSIGRASHSSGQHSRTHFTARKMSLMGSVCFLLPSNVMMMRALSLTVCVCVCAHWLKLLTNTLIHTPGWHQHTHTHRHTYSCERVSIRKESVEGALTLIPLGGFHCVVRPCRKGRANRTKTQSNLAEYRDDVHLWSGSCGAPAR